MKSDGFYMALGFCIGYGMLIVLGIAYMIDVRRDERKNKNK